MFSISQVKTFNELEMDIYEYVLNNKSLIPYLTIREFANEVNTSSTSVLRFCNKVDCNGFMEFKLRIKQLLKNERCSKITYLDDKVSLFQDFLVKTKTPTFREKVEKVAKIIAQSERIFCLGVGPTGSIAHYAANQFSVHGCFATYIEDIIFVPHTSPDLFLIFSVSGESPEMEENMRKIKEGGGQTIVITNSMKCTLAQLADYILPYNIYYAKSHQETNPDLNSHDRMNYFVDSFSSQLPTAYLIEIMANAIKENRRNIITK